MNRFLICNLILATLGTANVLAAPKSTGKVTEAETPDLTPKEFESTTYKLKIKAPGNWEVVPTSGGAAEQMPFLFGVPLDPAFLKSVSKKRSDRVRFYNDMMKVEVETLLDPQAKIESVVADFKEAIKKNEPDAKFKPDEKAKVAGLDAGVITVNLPGEHEGEQERVQRHVLLTRDGKRFDLALESHVYSYAKSLTQFQTVLKSAAFTAPAEGPDALLKKYEFAEQMISFKAPKTWQSGTPCHGARGAFIGLMLPVSFEELPDHEPDKPGIIFGDGMTVAVRPPKDPQSTLDAAVEEVKAEAKEASPTAEFKPVEKVKLGGHDAVILTLTSDGDKPVNEPKRLQRRVIAIRDGKLYQVIHSTHVNTAEKQKPVVDAIISSVQFTQVASAAPVAQPTTSGPGAADGF